MGSEFMKPATESCVCVDDYNGPDANINLYPSFFRANPEITSEHLNAAKKSWLKILTGSSSHFRRIKGQSPKYYDEGFQWFGDVLYDNFFEVHPTAFHLFNKDMSKQKMMIAKMISLVLDMIDRPNEIHVILIDLAVKHSKYGVHAVQYGIFCNSFIHALQYCLSEEYTEFVDQSWTRVRWSKIHIEYMNNILFL